MAEIILEIPFYDETVGGINRMCKIAVELPKYVNTSGGVIQSVEMAKQLKAQLRFQRKVNECNIDLPISYGLPDSTFPKCDKAITYSDNPHIGAFANLPQVKEKYSLMLSYGMCIERERKVALHPKVKCLTSTRRTQALIEAEGGTAQYVSFAFDHSFWKAQDIQRKNYAVILYHSSPDKNYDMAVKIANNLCDKKLIDGVVTFGGASGYDQAVKPKKLIQHISNATREQVRDIFAQNAFYIMPSYTEGLNLTPIEATLCGCPSVICDGAMNEIFYNGLSCMIAEKNEESITSCCMNILSLREYFSRIFEDYMRKTMQEYTMERHIGLMKKALEV